MNHLPSRLARLAALLAALTLALAAGCRDDSPTSNQDDGDRAPAFRLVDLNSSSPTHDQSISPRDHLGRVSAWYFGHST